MSQFDGRDNIAVTDIVRGIDKQRWKQLKKYRLPTLCALVKKKIYIAVADIIHMFIVWQQISTWMFIEIE